MKIATRYDVPPHLHCGGTSRNTSTGILTNTNCLGVYNSPDIIPTPVSSLPNDIVIDILSRLPAKPLMQFKSICKHWLSLIKHDPHFIDLHCIRSKSRPNLLYINPLPEKGIIFRISFNDCFSRSKSLQQSISCGEIVDSSGGEEQEVYHITSKVRITDDKWFPYNQVLEPVNGLVCFVDWKTHAIKVYNASTREEIPWVESTLLEEENAKLAIKDNELTIKSQRKEIYRFGFDPEKREYKVFCFWRLVARRQYHISSSMDRPDYESWEALTVGHGTKWRRINAAPNENNQIKIEAALPPAYTRQVYADGTMYWIAFDVESEKYRVIPIPNNFILDEPRDVRIPIDMVVLGGQVALLYRLEPYTVKLWMLDDRADKKLENCQGNKSDWSSETITLPFCCDNRTGFFGIAGSTNKMPFECRGCTKKILPECQGCTGDLSFTCLNSYDRRKKTFKKIKMDGVSPFTLYSERSLVTTFTESLFPVSVSAS
ncbi:hypothetical protein MKW98_021765 [Papaver atlanticum]|uniref:F-box domain-containing protein n=1 Tax=Papaver atlanticum TaxID=357466 RepID=A0AAD4XEA9_9MAGN|nr:hypothetical protein MKW98_021765 [Papaver atlanticum]